MSTAKTNEEFIKQCFIKHCNYFDYSKVEYINSTKLIIIICPIHGEFEQQPRNHLNGKGCKQCYFDSKKMSLSNFIDQCNIIHNFKYDYSKVEYVNTKTKVEIICHLHGPFFQQARAHIAGQGCPVCGSIRTGASVKYTLEEFILQANKIHNNFYDYSKTEYLGSFTHIKIMCPMHGEFNQLPSNHLSGLGCSKCSMGSVSKSENEWLDSLKIPKENRQVSIKINNKQYFADALDPITNTVYEYYGDYWHGNPALFAPNDLNKKKGKTFQQLYNETMERENILKQAGYNVISIWENDWKSLSNFIVI